MSLTKSQIYSAKYRQRVTNPEPKFSGKEIYATETYKDFVTEQRKYEDAQRNYECRTLRLDELVAKINEAIQRERAMKSLCPQYNGLSWEKFQSTIMFNKTY